MTEPKEPIEIVRLNKIAPYLPVGRTQRDEIIKSGLLEIVPLTPGGRAKGVTKRSLIRYQRRIMGLSAEPDDGASDI
jgi:hypothetical protein